LKRLVRKLVARDGFGWGGSISPAVEYTGL